MKWLRWDYGRQASGYSKLLLASSKLLKFDCYILRFPVGVSVPEHQDPTIPGYEHHRFNYMVKTPCIGSGVVHVKGPFKSFGRRGMLFRPDLYPHSMTACDFIFSNESAYMLSIGWLKRAKS